MRYLTPTFALGVLRRGRPIEQFLGPAFHRERQGIRIAGIEPQRAGGYAIGISLAWDVGHDGFRDVSAFPPLDPAAAGIWAALADATDERDALETAGLLTGATLDGWTTYGVAADDYADYVRDGRLPHPLSPERATETVQRLMSGEYRDDRVARWWLDSLRRQLGCLHIDDMIFHSDRPYWAAEIVEHAVDCAPFTG